MAWYPDKSKEFKRQARLFSRAIVSLDGTVTEGLITFISERGINITSRNGDKFFKWGNVLEINE